MLVLRFETDPGPRNDPSFDFGLWGDRTLVLEGFNPAPLSHPSPPPLSITALVSRPAQGTTPPSAFPSSSRWKREGDGVSFRYEGDDGTMEYRWEQPAPGQPQGAATGLFGKILLTAAGKAMTAVRVPLATAAQAVWSRSAKALGNRWEMTSEAPILVRTFAVGDLSRNRAHQGLVTWKEPGLRCRG